MEPSQRTSVSSAGSRSGAGRGPRAPRPLRPPALGWTQGQKLPGLGYPTHSEARGPRPSEPTVLSRVLVCFGVSAPSEPGAGGALGEGWVHPEATHVPPSTLPGPAGGCAVQGLGALGLWGLGDLGLWGFGVAVVLLLLTVRLGSPRAAPAVAGGRAGRNPQPRIRRLSAARPQRASPPFSPSLLFQRKPNPKIKAKNGRRSRRQSRTRAPSGAGTARRAPPVLPCPRRPGFPATENCTIFSLPPPHHHLPLSFQAIYGL